MRNSRRLIGVLLAIAWFPVQSTRGEEVMEEKIRLSIVSSLDGATEPADFYPAQGDGVRPMLVVLHPWSGNVDSYSPAAWVLEARKRNWHVLAPNFRGGNLRPEACASRLVRQDVLDAVALARARYSVDGNRIYAAGESGGGHLSLVMAAEAPELWAAVTAWVPISDLFQWHMESKQADRKYWKDIEAVAGGPPGSTPAVDAELRFRSPVFHLQRAAALPVDINAGIHDGYTGSVPIHHSLDAFNAIAIARGEAAIPEDTITALGARAYSGTEEPVDKTYGRELHFRQEAGPSRVTIFEGSHESIPGAACAWLERHARNPE